MKLAAAVIAAGISAAAAPAAPAATTAAPTATTAATKTVTVDPNALTVPSSETARPEGRRLTARQATRIGASVPRIRRELRRNPGATSEAYLKGSDRWQVSWFARQRSPKDPRTEIAQVTIADADGRVLEAWTGFQVAWSMARGYPGAFGRKVSALYVWLPLLALFIVPFVDWRRPLRWLHLDLAVLAGGLSVSWAFFTAGRIGWSVPLVYPVLLYLLVRMVILARRSQEGRDAGPLRLLIPPRALAVLLVFLVAFRVGLNVTNSNVIDVGYSGVVGADRIAKGDQIYGSFPADNQRGDTYGPVAYAAYVPFEQVWPWSGRWDDLPAAHGAAVVFDLLAIALLWWLGRRLRGPTLGIALAYAWAACPFTLLTMNSNANDALVAVLLIGALLASARPAARGAMIALAGLTKFAPLALGPLFATHRRRPDVGLRVRDVAWYAAGFAAAAAAAMLPVFLHGGLDVFVDRTLGFQETRGAPFSVWGYVGGLGTPQAIVKGAAVAVALAAAVVPRRRDVVGLAAAGAVVLIAVQLGVTYWFYLYMVWFLPLVLVALLGRYRDPAAEPAPPPAPAPGEPARVPVAA